MPTGDNDDESEDYGSDGKRELKGYTDGLHSPFGVIGQIKEKTGYSHEYILWGQPWIMFLIESADQPRYMDRKPDDAPLVESVDDAADMLGKMSNKTMII